MLKIAICDDDHKSIKKYSAQLERLADKYQIEISIKAYSGGEMLLFEWEDVNKQAEVLFLDIHMPGIDGMKTARELRASGCVKEIIFLTRDREPVFEAFDVEAFHYLVKDQIDERRFEEVFVKLVKRVEQRKRQFITFSFAGETRVVPLDQIKYFMIEGRSVTVHYGVNEEFEFYSTIGKLEATFCAEGYIRIHRSILVNAAYVRKATRKSVIMQDGTELPVSRNRAQELKETMERWGL